jgi:formylglycine-generating enzyme required for sulfatase activity
VAHQDREARRVSDRTSAGHQRGYARFVEETGGARPYWWKEPDTAEPGRPVLGVSWDAAAAYARWAGAELPTEVEWERAARGPDRWIFPWGNELGAAGETLEAQTDLALPWPPGSVAGLASREGCLDLVTRRWEWCADLFAPPRDVRAELWREVYPGWRPDMRALRGGELDVFIASALSRRGATADQPMLEATFRIARRG